MIGDEKPEPLSGSTGSPCVQYLMYCGSSWAVACSSPGIALVCFVCLVAGEVQTRLSSILNGDDRAEPSARGQSSAFIAKYWLLA
jgi:hypothetical protein